MKFVVLLGIFALAAAQPVKRFAGFGLAGLSSIGGSVGCVVTGNKLYINGLEGRELTSGEQQELRDYEQKLAAVRQEVKTLVEERRAEAAERRRSGEPATGNENRQTQKTPEAPKKPSFCSAEATTQYIFDGCKVQGNAVFVGNNYARKLSDSEIEELKQFDKEMTEYQKTVSATLESQLSELFGHPAISRAPQKAVTLTSTTPAAPPKTPNFCTLVV